MAHSSHSLFTLQPAHARLLLAPRKRTATSTKTHPTYSLTSLAHEEEEEEEEGRENMPSITCTSAGIKPALASLAALPPPHLVLFTATRVNGVPWCPDCARTVGGVRAAAEKLGGSLLEVEVERAEWKNPASPSPLRGEYGIGGIPALVELKEGGSRRVLGAELEGAANDAEAEKAVTGWVAAK